MNGNVHAVRTDRWVHRSCPSARCRTHRQVRKRTLRCVNYVVSDRLGASETTCMMPKAVGGVWLRRRLLLFSQANVYYFSFTRFLSQMACPDVARHFARVGRARPGGSAKIFSRALRARCSWKPMSKLLGHGVKCPGHFFIVAARGGGSRRRKCHRKFSVITFWSVTNHRRSQGGVAAACSRTRSRGKVVFRKTRSQGRHHRRCKMSATCPTTHSLSRSRRSSCSARRAVAVLAHGAAATLRPLMATTPRADRRRCVRTSMRRPMPSTHSPSRTRSMPSRH